MCFSISGMKFRYIQIIPCTTSLGKTCQNVVCFHARWPRIRYFRNFLISWVESVATKSEGRLRDKLKTEDGAGWKIRNEIRET